MSVEIGGKNYKVKKNGTVLKLKRKNINDISEIKNLESLSELKVLNLSSNQISEIKNLNHLKNLEKLDLSSNQISEIKGLDECINLKVLHLQDNSISKIKGLDRLKQLEELDLSNTLIEEIENLEHLENLKLILFKRSPFYREFINTFKLINEKHLDNVLNLLFGKSLQDKSPISAFNKGYIKNKTLIVTIKKKSIKTSKKRFLNPVILYYSKQPYEKRQEFKESGVITIDDRTYYGLESEKILQRIDEYFEENYFKEKPIYYPVEGITLIDLETNNEIKEEILYSTLSKITAAEIRNNYIPPARSKKVIPLFITKSGIGMLIKSGKEAHIFPWHMFGMPATIKSCWNNTIMILTNAYTPVRDAKFESEETFLERRKKFPLFCYLSCLRYRISTNNIVDYSTIQLYFDKGKIVSDYLFRDILHLIE